MLEWDHESSGKIKERTAAVLPLCTATLIHLLLLLLNISLLVCYNHNVDHT